MRYKILQLADLSSSPLDLTVVAQWLNMLTAMPRWAWQNPHLTRKIPDDQRITFPHSTKRSSRKTGQVKQVIARPKTSLVERLGNLNILLRVSGFARWPLEVRFFCEDVYNTWLEVGKKSNLPGDGPINVVRDFERVINAQSQVAGLATLDATYLPLKPYLEKAHLIRERDSHVTCVCCNTSLDIKRQMSLVCSNQECDAISHMDCLSERFLGPGAQEVIPIQGRCPKCSALLRWVDLR